jgi:Tfp pilus assembly protein PilF
MAAVLLLGAARWTASPTLPAVSVPTPELRAALQQRLGALGWSGRVRLDVGGAGDAAVVSGADIVSAHVPLAANPDAVEEILVDLAARLPELAAAPVPTLTSALNQTYVEATGILMNLRDGDVDLARLAATDLAQVRDAAPGHVGAWLAAARAELALAMFGDSALSHQQRAREYLHRALALDPHSVRAATTLAVFLNWHDWNSAASARWFALARRLAPQDTRVLHGLAWLELVQGRDADALAHIADAAARDPLDPELQANWGWLLYRTGDVAAALRQCRTAAHLPAAAESAARCESAALAIQGQAAAAWERLRAAPPAWLALHRAELESLPAAQAWAQSQRWAEAWWSGDGHSHYNAAVAAINAGDEELAMRDLSAALAAHEPMLRLAGATPEFAGLRGRADFSALLRRVREPAPLADRVPLPLATVGAPPPNAL